MRGHAAVGGAQLDLAEDQAAPHLQHTRQHRHLYGVRADQATATRPAYDARGGDAGWQLTLGGSRRIGRLWLGAYLRHDVVAGSVFADSPLVTARRSTSGGIAMSWVFAVSGATVPTSPY